MNRSQAVVLLVLAVVLLIVGGSLWLFAAMPWRIGGLLVAVAIAPAIIGGRRLRRP